MSAPIPHAVLMCHAPIVLPQVGKGRAEQCRVSTEGMRKAAQHLKNRNPDVVVVLSPHTPRMPHAFGLVGGQQLQGDFANFGAPEVQLSFQNDMQARAALLDAAAETKIDLGFLSPLPLDHGAAVPLAFLHEADYFPPVVVIGFPSRPTHAQCRAMGAAIRLAAERDGRTWAILASGDMSHRLIPGAPAGFDAQAKNFDAAFTECIGEGRFSDAVSLDEELRARAAEDVVDSVEIAAAACGFENKGHRNISYEGPFGVGYLVAVLHDHQANDFSFDAAPLFALARQAIRHHLQGASFAPQKTGDVYPSHHGLFVTLWKKDGGLRGCIGHTHKSSQPLDADVMQYAISAATQDPRFPPVTVDELDDLKMELSVLTPSEKISDRSQLDPKEYGIIVAAGLKRGVLLPEVQGVETVEQQIDITCRKANISSHEQMEIYRFRSIKFKEVS